ncbi:MAG: hypothetical protein QM733_04580 [Ilumatobacteraceae bacterium]
MLAGLGSDKAAIAIAVVSERLGLPGPTEAAVNTVGDKVQLRRVQERLQLPHPSFMEVGAQIIPSTASDYVGRKIAVKSVGAAASRGMTALGSSWQSLDLATAVAHAISESPTGSALIESWVDGPQFGGDALVVNGSIFLLSLTKRKLHNLVTVGHELWLSPPSSALHEIERQLSALCGQLNYTDGPLNFDGSLSSDGGVVFFELAARLGGNGITQLVEDATGGSPSEVYLAQLAGLPLTALPVPRRPAGSLLFYSVEAGIVEDYTEPSLMCERIPWLSTCVVWTRRGEPAKPLRHGGQCIGLATFTFDSGYDRAAAIIRQELALRVSPRSAE